MRQIETRLAVLGAIGVAALVLAASGTSGDVAAGAPAPAVGNVRAAQAGSSVTNLTARVLSSRRIELTFSAPGIGSTVPAYQMPARRYVIRQARVPLTAANFDQALALCGGACGFAVTRRGDRITLTVQDLIPNRLYYYALRPLDSAGRPGALSNVASARTLRDRSRPGRPRGLSARALRRGRVRLRWRAPGSDGRTGPAVRRFIVKQSTRPITSARRFRRARSMCKSSCRFAPRRRGSRLALTVRGLCPGRRYFYAIRALDEGGNLSRIARFRAVRASGRGGLVCR